MRTPRPRVALRHVPGNSSTPESLNSPQRPDQLIHLRPQRLVVGVGRGIARDCVEGAYPVRVHARAADRVGELGVAHFSGWALRAGGSVVAVRTVTAARDTELEAHIAAVKEDRDRGVVTGIEGRHPINHGIGKGRALRTRRNVVAIRAVAARRTLTAIGSARQSEGEVQRRPAQENSDRRGTAGVARRDAGNGRSVCPIRRADRPWCPTSRGRQSGSRRW